MTTQSQQIDQSSKFLQRISGLTFFLICLASSAIAGGLLFLIFGILATSLDGGPGLVTLMALGGFLIGLVGSIVYLKHRRKPSVIRSQSNETNTMKAAASLENNKVTNNINPLPNLLTLDDHTESKGEDQGEMIVDHKNIHERFFIPAEVRWQKRFSLIENMGDLTWANYVKLFKSLPLKERIPLISILAIFFGVLYYLWLGMWRKALIILATVTVVSILVDSIFALLDTETKFVDRLIGCALQSYCAFAVIVDYYKKEKLCNNSWLPWPFHRDMFSQNAGQFESHASTLMSEYSYAPKNKGSDIHKPEPIKNSIENSTAHGNPEGFPADHDQAEKVEYKPDVILVDNADRPPPPLSEPALSFTEDPFTYRTALIVLAIILILIILFKGVDWIFYQAGSIICDVLSALGAYSFIPGSCWDPISVAHHSLALVGGIVLLEEFFRRSGSRNQ